MLFSFLLWSTYRMSEIKNDDCQSSWAFLKSKKSFCLRVENLAKVKNCLLVFNVVYYSAFDARTERCQLNYAIAQNDRDNVWPSKSLACVVAFNL